MDTEHQKKKPSLAGGGNTFRSKILLLLGGATVLIIIVILFSSLFLNKGTSNVQLLVDLRAQQLEIIRVSALGLKSATDPDTLAFAETTSLSVNSQQSKLSTYMTSKGVKVTPLQLNAKLDKDTDAALISAQSSNRFNEELIKILKQNLTAYLTSLKEGYKNASNETSKQILSDSYNSTELLLK